MSGERRRLPPLHLHVSMGVRMTSTTQSTTFPVLPLPAGVILPTMVVTIALESDEAKAAAEAAGESGTLLLVPKVGERYAAVGTLARIESNGELPGGTRALVRSEEHTSELQSLMRISYAVFCLKKKK